MARMARGPGYASLVRESRKSGLLDDRRRGRRSVILELGKAAGKVSNRCQVAPEMNKIRLLAIARIGSSGHHSSLREARQFTLSAATTGGFTGSPITTSGALHIARKTLPYHKHEEEAWII